MNRLALQILFTVISLVVTAGALGLIYAASIAAWNHFNPGQPYPALQMLIWGFASWILHDCWSFAGREAAKEFPDSSTDH